MAKGFDELVDYLLDEVALRFADGKKEFLSLAYPQCSNLKYDVH